MFRDEGDRTDIGVDANEDGKQQAQRDKRQSRRLRQRERVSEWRFMFGSFARKPEFQAPKREYKDDAAYRR